MGDQEQDTSPEVIETPSLPEPTPMEKGTDAQGLFKKTGTETIEFAYDNKLWTFTYRHLTWAEHFKLVEEAWQTVTVLDDLTGKPREETVFSAGKYYEDGFLMVIQTWPGGPEPITRYHIRQFDTAVTQKLTNILPSPKLDDQLDSAKKA